MSDKGILGGNNLIYDTSNRENVLLRSIQWDATVWTLWYAIEMKHPYVRALTFISKDAAKHYDDQMQTMININRLMYPNLFESDPMLNKKISDATTAFEGAINAQRAAPSVQRLAHMKKCKTRILSRSL